MNDEDPVADAPDQSEQPEFSALEGRILGVLMEKQRTTPDYYPMTLNALVQACNQKTSRNPIMSLTSGEVGHAVNLRGSQTLGEIRSNTARMADFSDLGDVRDTIEDLMGREPPLVRFGRAPGHREERYSQLLCGDTGPDPATQPPGQTAPADSQRVDEMERQITQLRNELDALWRLTGLEKEQPDSE